MNNTVIIKPVYKFIGCVTLLNPYTLKIDCQPGSSIIISDEFEQCCDISSAYKNSSLDKQFGDLCDLYINVNSLLTCESFRIDFKHIYVLYPGAKITFAFNDCEYCITLEKDIITFSSALASMYAAWLAFGWHYEKKWLASVMAGPQGSCKPCIELLTKTLQELYSNKQVNLEDFDIKKIPYIKDVYKNCTYEFLEDTIHLLDKEQIISIIEELDEEDGERKVMLIRAAGLKDACKERFEL